ncbi:MAG: RDD family protein [Spirochaetaceae bacterium]|nr:RDD family protein [Spirochaetaceae bacterium]
MNVPSDSSLGVETPEGIEIILYPAGLLIRACAYAIDMGIQSILVIALTISAGILGQVLGLWFFMLLLFAINWFYQVIFELFFKGQSPGKRILGLRVVSGDGSPISPGASFLRNLLRFADTFMFLYLIALLFMTLSSGFRRLGDWAADTLVVYTANSRPPASLGAWTADVSAPEGSSGQSPKLLSLPVMSYEEKQAVLMFARRYPLLSPARGDEIAHTYVAYLREKADAPGLTDSEYLLAAARILQGDIR